MMRRSIGISLLSIGAAAAVVMFIVAGVAYSRRMKTAASRLASFHPVIAETALGPVEYEVRGTGPLVLVSHGITGGIDQCFGLSEAYLPHDKLQILAVSRFGYGGSPMPDASSPPDQADAFAALLEELHVAKAHVFGNSAGATAALQFAIRHPKKCMSLILVSANLPTDAGLPPKPVMQAVFGSDFVYWSVIRLFGEGMLRMAGVPAGILSAMDEETKRGIVENILLSGLPITARTKGVINDLYVSNTDMQKGYGFSEIHSPVLVIHARDDPAGNFPRAPGIAAQIPRCTLIAIESGGHLLLGSEDYVKDVAYDTIMAEEERNGLQADSGSRLGDM